MSLLLFLGVLSASAQEQKGTTEYVFNPHFYVMVQPLGAQYTLGEGSFKDLLSYNVQAAVGYNFTKVLGARFSVNAWQSKGAIELHDQVLVDNVAKPYLYPTEFNGTWKWNYVAPALEVTFNLTNLVNFNPKRLFNLYAFIGGGANIGFNNGNQYTWGTGYSYGNKASDVFQSMNHYRSHVYGLRDTRQNMDYRWSGTKVKGFGKAGLIFDFRINDRVSVNLEGNATMLQDKYNSKKAGNADWYFNALAGVKVNLGKTYTTKFTPAPEPEVRYVEKVVYKDRPIESSLTNNGPDANAAKVQTVESLRRDIFSKINSTVIRPEEAEKVKDIADYLQKHPNAKVSIIGYADAGTGNDRINNRLAAQRADAVVKALKTKYKIAADRITYDSKGAKEQPFAENDKNRVSICIAK